MKRLAPLAAILLACVWAEPADGFRRAGTTGAPFLKLAADARAAGLAGATVALPGGHQPAWAGAGNLLINPAGPAGSLENSLEFSQERRFAQISLGQVLGSRPLSARSTLTLGLAWLQVPEQEITTLEQPDGTGENYSAGDIALGLGLATRLTDRLAWGGLVRWIRQDLHRERAQGAAVDLGLLLDTGWRDLTLGLAVANFGPRLQLSGEDLLVEAGDGRPAHLQTGEFQLPLVFRAGLHDRLWRKGLQRLDGALQLEHPNDNRQNLRLGLEYAWQERVLLRAGRHFRRDLEQHALGLGLRLPLAGGRTLTLDYAWTTQQRLAATHQLAAGLLFH
jgi:hypothetical protein